MRTAITLHKVAGKWSVVSLPEVPIDDQKKAFKDLVLSNNSGRVEEVQIWESGSGLKKSKKFEVKPEEHVKTRRANREA